MKEGSKKKGNVVYKERQNKIKKVIDTLVVLVLSTSLWWVTLSLVYFFPHLHVYVSNWRDVAFLHFIGVCGLSIGIIVTWGLSKKLIKIADNGVYYPLAFPVPKRRGYMFIPYEDIHIVFLNKNKEGKISSDMYIGMILFVSEDFAKTHNPYPSFTRIGRPLPTRYMFSGKHAVEILPHLKKAMGIERWNELINKEILSYDLSSTSSLKAKHCKWKISEIKVE